MSWRFLTNHGRLLLCLASDPSLRIRDLATILGITERSTQKILGDLVTAGYVTRKRVGRRNEYQIHAEMPLPLSRELSVHRVLETFRIDEGYVGISDKVDTAASAAAVDPDTAAGSPLSS